MKDMAQVKKSATRRQRCGMALTLAALGITLAALFGSRAWADDRMACHVEALTDKAAGRYLILLGGCNDCHTSGWVESGGKLPASEWLTGNPVGFRGPWGTSYPSNLRLSVQGITEDGWIQMFRTRTQYPPMYWLNYHGLSGRDLSAMYRFIKALGPKGVLVPAHVPPNHEPKTPYVLFVPQAPTRK